MDVTGTNDHGKEKKPSLSKIAKEALAREHVDLEPLSRLSRDLAQAAATLSDDQARYLVDTYYSLQEYRKAAGNQMKALSKSEEPHGVIAYLFLQMELLEKQVARALGRYAESKPIGKWLLSITGIGPIITAGLIAHIDIARCETASRIWAYAGLDPSREWLKGQKRPWNAKLKNLQWKVGESFVKVSGKEDDFYGKIYIQKKEVETRRNLSGQLADQARAKLEKFNIGKDTDAYLWYSGCLTPEAAVELLENTPSEKRMARLRELAGKPGSGLPMLPPDHIHARAKRFAVKLFLSHLHEVWYYLENGTRAPKPYAFSILEHDQGSYIAPPNWTYPASPIN